VEALASIIKKHQATTQIEIDGGVTDQNAQALIASGAHVLVAGSYVFGAENPEANIRALKK